MVFSRFLNGQPTDENGLSGIPAGRAADEAVRNANARQKKHRSGEKEPMAFPGRREGGEIMTTGNDVR